MIATTIAGPTVLVGPGTERIRVRCLARRGMLHSETEAIDYVRLSPGACFDLVGREGTEAAWYVLRGPVALLQIHGDDCQLDGHERLLTRGDLVLAPRGEHLRLYGGPLGAELLCLTVTPRAESDRLPPRRPEMGTHP
jgi:hypothetical protein